MPFWNIGDGPDAEVAVVAGADGGDTGVTDGFSGWRQVLTNPANFSTPLAKFIP
jgi:hypothetical protein